MNTELAHLVLLSRAIHAPPRFNGKWYILGRRLNGFPNTAGQYSGDVLQLITRVLGQNMRTVIPFSFFSLGSLSAIRSSIWLDLSTMRLASTCCQFTKPLIDNRGSEILEAPPQNNILCLVRWITGTIEQQVKGVVETRNGQISGASFCIAGGRDIKYEKKAIRLIRGNPPTPQKAHLNDQPPLNTHAPRKDWQSHRV